MNSGKEIGVIGCGRWGSFITWYLDRIGMKVTLYGKSDSHNMIRLIKTRKNDLLSLGAGITLTTDIEDLKKFDIIIVSIDSQGLRGLLHELTGKGVLPEKIVLCMKGLEIGSAKRLTEVVSDVLPDTETAVWIGPGHVQDFLSGIPNCMVIDSKNAGLKKELVETFTSDLIRFYYGADLIGNEIGAASKNVIGIAAGILDGLGLTALKGALMSRGTREIARLIKAMGGNELSAYGLCHLGDYQATVFSPYSHNRQYGECLVTGKDFSGLAEGYYTAKAMKTLAEKHGTDLPICSAVYSVLYDGKSPRTAIEDLFLRSLKSEI